MLWGTNLALFQDPQDNSAMKGFDEYFEEFCAQKDLEIENSHPLATCTNGLALPLGPSPFQCKESEATGTLSGCRFGNPLSENYR